MHYRLPTFVMVISSLSMIMTCHTSTHYYVEIPEDKLVEKITQHIHEKLLNASEHTVIDYVCELQAFIPEYTQHSWETIRPLLLEKLTTEIEYYQKRSRYWMNIEEVRTGLGCITIGIFSAMVGALCDDFLYADIRRKKTQLKDQFQIRERVTEDHFSRTKTTTFSAHRGQDTEKSAALNHYMQLWKQEKSTTAMQAIPAAILACAGMTAIVCIYAGVVSLFSALKNPHYQQRYEKLSLFKTLVHDIQEFDKYQYPTPLIVDLEFLAHAAQ